MMNRDERSKMTKLEWGVLFSVIVTGGNVLFSAGVIWTTVQVHEREIVDLKAKGDATIDRLARMETKIDLLLDQRPLSRGVE